jgi:hypothetical protein
MAIERKAQDYSFTSGLANVNPAELPPEALEKYQGTLKQGIEALEKRYDEPNWWKVAAGFAKPQLGGFIASLGSAADAAGDTEEQRREQLLPISQMKAEIDRSNMLLGQKKTQNQIYQDWLAKNTKPDGTVTPMDATTYSRITSLGEGTPVALAAKAYYEGAEKGLGITTAATKAMGADPMLQLDDFAKFQLNPNTDPKKLEARQAEFGKAVDAARPPQVEPAQWAAMSRYDKMEAAANYAREQREKGMSTEEILRQQSNTAPERLGLLRSIRDLALGSGIPESTTKDGQKLSGQEQMAALLNMFGGNNPMEVFARAMADNKGPALLADIDKYARQYGMSEEAKNKFQVLVKLLAENQVSLRNSALNPTNAFSELQQLATPTTMNSQKALVTLVDLMGHAEKNAQERYNYAKDNKLPYGQLERDVGYNKLRSDYAEKHLQIATGDPIKTPPSWYNPSSGNVNAKPEAKPQSNAPAASGSSNLTLDAIKAERAKREAAKKQNP